MPRLLTRISTLGTALRRMAAPSAVAGSASTPRTSAPPDVRMPATAWSSLTWLRPVTTTLAPSTASLRAIARPMPAVDPVTSAVLPLSCRSMWKLRSSRHHEQFTLWPVPQRSFPDGGDTHLLQKREGILDMPIVGDATAPNPQQI